MDINPLLFVLIVLTAALVFEGVRSLIGSEAERRSAQARKRLRKFAAPLRRNEDPTEGSLLRSKKETSSGFEKLIAQLPFYDELALHLYRSGQSIAIPRFLALSACFALVGAWSASTFLGELPGATFVGLAAGLLPYWNARRMARKRVHQFEAQFPDALDLLIRALRAGHAFSVGLQMVGEELPDPVGREFAIVADEIQLGMDSRKALGNLAKRVPSPDLPFFVVAVSLQQETGSNLAEVLGNLSSVIRERFKLYGKVNALTAMGRASANLLAVWPAVMLGALYTVNPDYIAPLWETEAGHTMVMVAAAMVAFGYYVCRRMATIEV